MAEKETELKIKKKKWHPIIAPKIFSEQVIGEILVSDVKSIIGRTISANLMNLTGDPKKQNINMKFIVTKIDGNKAFSDVVGYIMSPSSMKRMIRRDKERIDDSFVCKTLDNVSIRLKPLAITTNATKSSVLTALRKKMLLLLRESVAKLNYEAILYEVIDNKLQRKIKADLSKIYPVKNFEIKMLIIEKIRKKEEKQEEQPKIEEVKEEITSETKEAEEEKEEEKKEEVEGEKVN